MMVSVQESLPISIGNNAPEHLATAFTEYVGAIDARINRFNQVGREALTSGVLAYVQDGVFRDSGWEPVVTLDEGEQVFTGFPGYDIDKYYGTFHCITGQTNQRSSYIITGCIVDADGRALELVKGRYRHETTHQSLRFMEREVCFHATMLAHGIGKGAVRFALLPSEDAEKLTIHPRKVEASPRRTVSSLTVEQINRMRKSKHCGNCTPIDCCCKNISAPPLTVHPDAKPE